MKEERNEDEKGKIYEEDLLMQRNADFHVHSSHSIDADKDATIERYCIRAIEKGINDICFTTHIDFNPHLPEDLKVIRFHDEIRKPDLKSIQFYIDEVHKLQKRYLMKGLNVYVGVEVDYSTEYEDEIINNIPWNNLDLIVVGVHYLNEICIVSSKRNTKWLSKISPTTLLRDYYKKIEAAIKLNLFNTIAHLDQYKRFCLNYYGTELLNAEKKILPNIFSLMADYGIAIELNTSKRVNEKEYWSPNREILKLACMSGVKKFTVGSDCHKINDLGHDVQEALEYANKIGMSLLKLPEKNCLINIKKTHGGS